MVNRKSIHVRISNRNRIKIVIPIRPRFLLHPEYCLSLLVGSGVVPLDILLRIRASVRVPTDAASSHSRKGEVVELADVTNFLEPRSFMAAVDGPA